MKQITYFKSSTQKEYSIRILKVLEYINNNLSEELTLKNLSEISCFSQFHFHRIFSAFMNESPADYITRLRLERAAVLLTTYIEMPVTEVSFKCGFSSSSVFARAFKSHFKCTASQWRSGKSREYKNSKNCKTESKQSKEFLSPEEYFSDIINMLLKISEGESMKGEIKELQALHIAYVVNLEGYNEKKIEIAYEKICRWAGARGLLNPETKYIGISLDDPEITPKDKCRFYASVSVPPHTEGEGEIQVMDLPSGKYAVVHFEGTGDGIVRAYKYAYGNYIPSAGYLPEDTYAYEIYYNDPGNEKKFVMDICIPVKPM
ncbi:MAG: AraC family transcriptional regulator [Ignavibacteriaceae bacterium]